MAFQIYKKEEDFSQPPIYDETVKTTQFSIDWNLNKILEIVCKCGIFRKTNQDKIDFVNAILTFHTLATPYWILDLDYQQKIKNIDEEYQDVIAACEPNQQNWINGKTQNGLSLLDIAVSFSQKKFQLLMIVLSKANKSLNKEDEL